MKKIAVLGAGMVGSVIAADLSEDYIVTVIDKDVERLSKLKKIYKIKTFAKDISGLKSFKKLLRGFDLVISAVPGFMGYETLRKIIESGKDAADISFFEEDPFKLNHLAKRNNVTAVVDCGVAPGLSNIILGRHNSKMIIDSLGFNIFEHFRVQVL